MKKPAPDYELFKTWFSLNGGLANKIEFPVNFAPIGYTGVAAKQDVKANQVFLAVPKKIIISVSKVRDSALGSILEKYSTLNDNESEETDFNILTLYLIWQKMLGTNSFFYPYLQAVDKAETIITWPDDDVVKLKDPYITLQLVEQLRAQFPPVYEQFRDLSRAHPEMFSEQISWDLFMECYAFVMTRCFGWVLPETMLVPFADFLNHNCHGVHHYICNRKLEENSNHEFKQYVTKRKQIDLSLIEVNNKSQLPISYELNSRQKFIKENISLIGNPTLSGPSEQIKHNLHSGQIRANLDEIHRRILPLEFNVPLYPSSNSEDNDSEEEDVEAGVKKQQMFTKELRRISREETEHKFEEPEPSVNSEFQDGVTFNWWSELEESDSYFIVAASRYTRQGEQIFNSYGRRSNRFLLVWYGFAHFNNKYDSICFRFWDETMHKKTGRLIFVQYITQKDLIDLMKAQNGNFNVTDEFRLKRDNLCYELMAYLRLRVARNSALYKSLLSKRLLQIQKIQNLEIELETMEAYLTVLKELQQQYRIDEQRPRLSSEHHNYFAHLLASSNRQIIQNHKKGVQMLVETIDRVKRGENLIDVYRSQLKCEASVSQISAAFKNEEKFMNRRFVLDYFKILDRFVNSKSNLK